MSPATQLFEDLRSQGITFQTNGQKLRFWPKSAIDQITLDSLRTHKKELIALVQKSANDRMTKDKSIEKCGKTDLLSFETTDSDKMVAEHIERISTIFPAGAVVSDWNQIDAFDAKIAAARKRVDAASLGDILHEYEQHIRDAYGCGDDQSPIVTVSQPGHPAASYEWADSITSEIQHKDLDCGSANSWQHVWGGQYCRDCWPPVEPGFEVQP